MQRHQPKKSRVLLAVLLVSFCCLWVCEGERPLLWSESHSTSCSKLSHADCVSQCFLFTCASDRSLILMKLLFLKAIFKGILFVQKDWCGWHCHRTALVRWSSHLPPSHAIKVQPKAVALNYLVHFKHKALIISSYILWLPNSKRNIRFMWNIEILYIFKMLKDIICFYSSVWNFSWQKLGRRDMYFCRMGCQCWKHSCVQLVNIQCL